MDWAEVQRKLNGGGPGGGAGGGAGGAIKACPRGVPREAVRKAPEERSEQDVHDMVAYIRGLHISFIDDYFPEESREEVLEAVCRAMTFESVGPGRTLFSKGDQSDKFYVVISGSASVWVEGTEACEYPTAANVTKRKLMRRSDAGAVLTPSIARLNVDKSRVVPRKRFSSSTAATRRQRLSSKRLMEAEAGGGGGGGGAGEVAEASAFVPPPLAEDPEGASGSGGGGPAENAVPAAQLRRQGSRLSGRRGSDGRKRVSVNPETPSVDANIRSISDVVEKDREIFVGFMRPGGPTGSFGELGLVSESHTRSATVRTDDSACEFLTLGRDAFDRVLKARFVAALDAKVAAMQRFALFEGISDSHLRILALYVQRRVYKDGDVLARKGQMPSMITCLVDGQLEMAMARDKAPAAASRRQSLRERPEIVYTRVAVVPAGSMVGHKEALATPQRAFAHHVRAVGDCVTLQIDREAYVRRVRQDLWKQLNN